MFRYFIFFLYFPTSFVFCQSIDYTSLYIEQRVPVNTGVNMTIAIMDMPNYISNGDTIFSLFKNSDDTFFTAGMTIWEGERLAIALWGNDSTSNIKDGFSDNEQIYWAYQENELYILLEPHYRQGDNYFKANGLAIIDSLTIVR